ncbi:arylamine N-acetyltransferase [Streptomyces sp. M19]
MLRWRVETHPRELDDFAAVMWYCSTSPDMPGADQLWASIVTPTGRVSVFNRTITEYANGQRTSRLLDDDEEFLKEFEFWYGIKLGRIPDVPLTLDGV